MNNFSIMSFSRNKRKNTTKGKIRNLLYKLRKEKKIYMKKILPKKWIYLIQNDFENKD